MERNNFFYVQKVYTMSGRGKGGKGLGKGGAKRHRKVLRDNIQGAYSFKYSPRPGTPAANKEEINKDILDERLAITQELLDEQQMEYNRNFITKTVKVLIDGAGKHAGQIKGKSEFNQSVALEGEENHIGQIISVQIKDVKMHSLIGERA